MKTISQSYGISNDTKFVYVDHYSTLNPPIRFYGVVCNAPAMITISTIGVWKVKQSKSTLTRNELYNICKPNF